MIIGECVKLAPRKITERELWAYVNHYIREHGDDALMIAALRCDELLDAFDFEGARAFQAIIVRINRLLDVVPDGPLH